MQRGLNGAGSAFHQCSGLICGKIFKIPQNKDFPLAGAKLLQSPLDLRPIVQLFKFAEGVFAGGNLGFDLGIEVFPAFATKFAGYVQGNAKRPSLKLAVATEGGELAEEAKAGFLRGIGGLLGVSKLSQRKAIPHVLKAREELPAGGAVASAGGMNRRGIDRRRLPSQLEHGRWFPCHSVHSGECSSPLDGLDATVRKPWDVASVV